MIRRFNYTGRKKIDRDKIKIQLNKNEGLYTSFDAQINLEDYNFPGNTAIYVEARDKSSYMRFPFGSISTQTVPDNRILSEIQSELVSFRIKLVDESNKHGLILASSEISVSMEPEPEDKSKMFILPLVHADLEDQIWKIDFREKPHLMVNKKIDLIDEFVDTPYFLGLVFPAVVRLILIQILIVDSHEYDESGFEDWQDLWIRFVNNLPGIQNRYDPEEFDTMEEKIYWIEEVVVPAFCTAYNTLKKVVEVFNGDEI